MRCASAVVVLFAIAMTFTGCSSSAETAESETGQLSKGEATQSAAEPAQQSNSESAPLTAGTQCEGVDVFSGENPSVAEAQNEVQRYYDFQTQWYYDHGGTSEYGLNVHADFPENYALLAPGAVAWYVGFACKNTVVPPESTNPMFAHSDAMYDANVEAGMAIVNALTLCEALNSGDVTSTNFTDVDRDLVSNTCPQFL